MLRRLLIGAMFLLTSGVNATSCEHSEPQTKFIYGKTMDTIGDSHVWITNGNYLRCLLRDKGLKFDFVGNHQDTFGFKHDGEGGNNTQAVLNRIGSIPYANAYFVVIGTNDVNSPPGITIQNMMAIGYWLHVKNPSAPIFINTILPNKTKDNVRVQQVNDWLMLLSKKGQLCSGCYLLDAAVKFYKLPNWDQYFDSAGVHLTLDGYEEFTNLVMDSLKKIGYL